MQREFWQAQWDKGQIGFHRPNVNVLLQDNIAYLEHARRVYVPLCGKSLDLRYLRERGHEVFGTEIVTLAIEQLFAELGETPRVSKRGPYTVHEVPSLTILEGDAFLLTPEHLGGPVDGIYDRGSLVALEPSTRAAFVQSFERVLAKDGRIAEVVFAYDQTKVDGPPWSVTAEDIESLFGKWADIRVVAERDESVGQRMSDAGVSRITEYLYGIERR
jgi:thiopurine S-methyltransferase